MKILLVEDSRATSLVLSSLLREQGHEVANAENGAVAVEAFAKGRFDVILMDIEMPVLDGFRATERIRELERAQRWAWTPVIFLTASDTPDNLVTAIRAGGDDFIAKGVSESVLAAKMQAMLRIAALRQQLEQALQTTEAQAQELVAWNHELERRVADGVAQIERLNRLRRFFSPAVADLLLSGDADDPLRPHRREIVVMFLDLRGYTAFTEAHGPDEVMRVLGEFHQAMGSRIMAFGGTLERFAGDGMMIFFNDPVAIPQPARVAARLALDMLHAREALQALWQARGYMLDMGIGIARGEATIGGIGFEGRRDYGAIGRVTNLAARLCADARGGEVLVDAGIATDLDGEYPLRSLGERNFKGFAQPLACYALLPTASAAPQVSTALAQDIRAGHASVIENASPG